LGFKTLLLAIEVGGGGNSLWTLSASGRSVPVPAPVVEVGGKSLVLAISGAKQVGEPRRLANGAIEYAFEGTVTADPALSLRLEFRVAKDSPVVRFRFVLLAREKREVTKTAGVERLSYLSLSLAGCPRLCEVRLGSFLELAHSYVPEEREVPDREFEDGLLIPGPILAADGAGTALMTAFEHGCTVPDAFIRYRLSPGRNVLMEAAKGNYWNGREVSPGNAFEMPWLHLALVAGGRDDLAKAYREFILRYQSENLSTRKPWIFYNTWNYQERNQAWNGKKYLDSMNGERMLQEIEVAARMGIDVFVLDTGWYEKTGDWAVSRKRFPDGLKAVRKALEGHGMKLGLWFNPTVAAVSSRMRREHEDCLMTWDGQAGKPGQVWETEESQGLCLVSRYADSFADELIRLNREVGVTYFKWDAVGQYGCNDPRHLHGGESATPGERADAYAFLLPRFMGRVVDRLVKACPEAIVDFDITEKGRAVGLGFLASGKYFIINNGPYNFNYDFPDDVKPMFINLFVRPGAARGWICRQPLPYDRWIPSVLFLTHYLPDDPAASRTVNMASLVLGQNGIWGDLVGMSREGVEHFHRVLSVYKTVRDDITSAYPVTAGSIGGCPEVHEKVSAKTGRGVVVIFATERGTYSWVTENRVDTNEWHEGDVTVERDAAGRARIEARFAQPGAVMVFFGAKGP